MAVYTHYSFEQLSNMVRTCWSLTLVDAQPVAAGIENSIYSLTCQTASKHNTERYALVVFEDLSPESVEMYCEVLNQIQAQAGFENQFQISRALPLAKRSDQGFKFTYLDHKPIVLQPWIAGQPEQPTPSLCMQLGQRMRQIHSVNIPEHTHLPFNEHLCRIETLLAKADQMSQTDQDFALTTWRSLQTAVKLHPDMQQSIVHGDLFYDNALVLDGQLSGIIDFFAASKAPRLVDFAICLIAWCTNDQSEFLFDHIEAFTTGYTQGHGLKNVLPAFDCEQLLSILKLVIFRFWCSRQTYQLHCQALGLSPVEGRHPEFCYQLMYQLDRVSDDLLLKVLEPGA